MLRKTCQVFGPIPSRRLGRSLGIDPVPMKTCTYDCVYCQLGRTTNKTIERKSYVHWESILSDLNRKAYSRVDYITLSGSGEPTLHLGLGELIERIKAVSTIPVAVLTNGSLLWRADVREELQHADLVIPSLDAGDASRFRFINRPHESISFTRMVEGLISFRQEYRGRIWLEVLLLAGLTSTETEVTRIARWVSRIKPDRVQLNTATRPSSEPFSEAVPRDHLARLACLFEPRAEVIADYPHAGHNADADMLAGEFDILELLRRRPCSVDDIVSGLGLHMNEVIKHLDALRRQNRVERVVQHDGVFYRAIRASRPGIEE